MSNKEKAKQLGMPYGTANGRLRKSILFSLIKECKKDICFQCKQRIEKEEDLSIEHKEPWLHKENAKELFFDLNNISFSHLKCNIGASRQFKKGEIKHPSHSAYRRGCRCDECKELARLRIKDYRKRRKEETGKDR